MNISTIARDAAKLEISCYVNKLPSEIGADVQRAIDAATAEKDAEIARLQKIARELEAALEYVRDNGQLARHGHWDPEGTHGAHCSICCAQRDTAERVREALNRIEVKSCQPDTRSAATASVASPEPQPVSNSAPSEVPPSAEAAFRELKEWQLATFPDESPREVFNHLSEEIRELGQKLNDPAELADVLMLALCLCFRQGIDPVEAIRQKHAVNLQRRWEKTGAGFRHVKEPSAEAAIGEHMNPMSNTVRLQQNEIVTLRAEVERLTKELDKASNWSHGTIERDLTTDRDRLAAELAAAKAAVEAAFREGADRFCLKAFSAHSEISQAWLASDARRKLEGGK